MFCSIALSSPKAGEGPLFSSQLPLRRMWLPMSKKLLSGWVMHVLMMMPSFSLHVTSAFLDMSDECKSNDDANLSGIAWHLSPFTGIVQQFSWTGNSYWTSLKRFHFLIITNHHKSNSDSSFLITKQHKSKLDNSSRLNSSSLLWSLKRKALALSSKRRRLHL